MNNVNNAKLERMEKRLSQLSARVQLAQARKARIDRGRETRRRLLAGDYLFKLLGSDWERVGKRLHEASMLKPSDARLFQLEEKSDCKAKTAVATGGDGERN